MQRAVIYARFSSSRQREESIEGQIRVCTAFAERNDYNIIAHYIDRAQSGRSDKRTDFQRLIADSSRRSFDVVLVYDFNRFARNRYDSAVYKMKLKKNGVRVISATEYLGDGPSSILFESMLEGMAEYYSAELAQKIKRGMTENALKCRWNCRIPLGYKLDECKRLVIDPATAPIISAIFDMYVKKYKITDIMRQTNERFYAATGRKLSPSAFSNIIANKAYIGTYQWGDIIKEDAFPPIVTKEIFMLANQRHESQKKNKPVRTSSLYLLTTKLKCGRCGASMTGMSGTSRTGETHYYYACHNRRKFKTCDMHSIRIEAIEGNIIEDATSILSNPDAVNLIAEKAMEIMAEPEEVSDVEILKAERKDIIKKINNCLKVIEEGNASDIITQRIKEHESRLKTIDEEIAIFTLYSNPLNLTKERIVYYLLNGLKDEEKRREFILTALVKEVILNYNPDTESFTAEIFYNYSNNALNCNVCNKAVRNIKVWWN